MMSYRRDLCFLFIFIFVSLFLCPHILFGGTPPGTIIKNTVSISFKDVNNNPFPANSADVETLVLGPPELMVQKISSIDPIALGSSFFYTIHYENTGGSPATGVKIVDTLSPHLKFQSASQGGVYEPAGGTVAWDIGTLLPNQNGAVTINVQVKVSSDYSQVDPNRVHNGDLIYNTTRITSNQGISNETTTTIPCLAPDFDSIKSATPPIVGPAGYITYTIYYKNKGAQEASEVFIQDTLPNGVDLLPGSITGNGVLQGRTITWNIGAVAPGEEGTVSFQVSIPVPAQGNSAMNFFVIASKELGEILSNEVITQIGQPLFTFTKEDKPDPVFAGNIIKYTIHYKNEGAIPLTDVVITDNIPEHTFLKSVDPNAALIGNELRWQIGDILPGEEVYIHIIVQVDPYTKAGEMIKNQAYAITKQSPEPSPVSITTVAERTPPVINFYDKQWNDTSRYLPGDEVCIEVKDADRNADPDMAEAVTVDLIDPNTNDHETITLTETGVNTGIFRNCLPSNAGTASTAVPGDGKITVLGETNIRTTYWDTLDGPYSQAAVHDEAFIDPFGIVFNSATGDPVPNAVVTLYDASANIPVVLPLCPDGTPQPNPFTTGADGVYAFPCVPAGTYYLQVAPGTDYSFPSHVSLALLQTRFPGFDIEQGSLGSPFTLITGMQPLRLDIPVDPPGELKISKTASKDPVAMGVSFRYTIHYENTGGLPATGVKIIDHLSPLVKIRSVTPGGIYDSKKNTIIWDIPLLNPGESGNIILDVMVRPYSEILQIDPNLGRKDFLFYNTAEITSKEGITDKTTISTLSKYYDIKVTKAATPDVVSPGGVITYTLHYKNAGQFDSTEVFIKDTLPDGVELAPGSITGNGALQGRTLTWDMGTLSPGAEGDLSFQAVVSIPAISASIKNICSISSFEEGEILSNAVITTISRTVFNSITGDPISFAVVTLYDGITKNPVALPSCPDGTLQQNPFTTGTNGLFSFPCVPAGHYYIQVDPGPDYLFPSKMSDSQLPSGFTIESGSRGGAFILTQQQSINFDIPVDPPSDLEILKSANKSTVSIGDMLKYTLSVQNKGAAVITEVKVIDILPHGFQYLKGSTTIKGAPFSDPEFNGETNLVWTLANIQLSPHSSIDISYQVVIGPDSNRGDGRNVAYTEGDRNGVEVRSKYAEHTVKVQEGIFTTKGVIIGKVFLDKNADKAQGGPCKRVIELDTAKEDEEPGIPGVAIYLEDGTKVTTDKNGKFSIPGVKPGDHVLRIDETTLPKGLEPVATSNRFMLSDTSQFADMKPGGLFKANFAVQKIDDPNSLDNQKMPQIQPSEKPLKEIQEKGIKLNKGETLEDIIRGASITADLDFLSPEDGSVLSSRYTDIIVKTPSETELTLWVNDKEISPKRVGKKVMNRERRVTIYQFIGLELIQGERNRIKAQAQESGGMITVKKEISVVTIGRPSLIEVAQQTPVSAGTSSQADFRVAILDKNNYPVPTPKTVTVSTTLGEIINKDLDPTTPGTQIPCSEGAALFSIKPSEKSGDAEITVVCDNIKKTVKHFFPPYLRDLMVVGIGEITVGKGSASANYHSIKDEEGLKDDFYLWGRGAAFVKGRVGKDILLTGMYDTAKDKEDEFFRESDKDFESEAKYLIYGDESTIEYEGYSRTKLFLRLEKNKSYLMYGDYETNLNQAKIAAYTRTLNGFASEINTGRLNLHAFVSYTDQTHIVEKLPGKGIARYYTLSSSPIIEGSEIIVIETRDRQRPEYVLKRERMERGADYYIDYDLGTIIFKMPVPSHDEYFNPLYIIVTYESQGNGDKYYIYGGRVGFEITKNLALGFTSVTQEQETEDYTLLGTDITLRLPLKSTLKAELAQTESMFTIDSVYSLKRDTGWSLEFTTNPLKPFTLTGYYRNIGDYFQNDSAIDAMPGMEKYGADAIIEVNESTSLKGKFFDERDSVNDMQHRFASAGFEKRYEKTKLEMRAAYETSNDSVTSLNSLVNRYPFENSEDTPEKAATISADVERKLTDKLILKAGHIQSFKYSDFYISHAGIDYSLSSLAKIYVTQEYGKYDERMDTRTVMGVESQVGKNTVAYNEYRLDDGVEGERNQHIIGLRNKFIWREKVTGNISFENQSTLNGKEKVNEPDAFATSAGFEYLPKENVKWTTRYEYRHQKSEETSNLAEIGLAYKLTSEHSILFKERFYNDDYVDKGDRVISRTLFGLAYRPVEWDVFNALAKLEFKHEKDLSLLPELRSDAVIGSVEGVYQATPKTQIIGKYAGKLARESGFSSYTDLVSGRLILDLSDRFDLGLEYRILNSHDVRSIAQGGSAEVGYCVVKNLWFSAGYCFDKFDPDLSNDSYRGEGPYLKIRFKFDENTLKDLKSRNKGK